MSNSKERPEDKIDKKLPQPGAPVGLEIKWSPDFQKYEPDVKCAECKAGLHAEKESWYVFLFYPVSKAETLPGMRYDENTDFDGPGPDWVHYPLCFECTSDFQDKLEDLQDKEGEQRVLFRYKDTAYLHDFHDCWKQD